MHHPLVITALNHALQTADAPRWPTPVEVERIDSWSVKARNEGLSHTVYALVYGVLGRHTAAARVYLNDLAEWLLLPPTEMRFIEVRIQEDLSRRAS